RMESLYEYTTVIVTADNAFLLPQAKNDSGRGSENAHRTAVVISDPVHRVPGAPARVLDAFTERDPMAPEASFAGAGAPDLFPTILDYATGGALTPSTSYPFRTSLRPLARGTATTRRVYYGHAVNGTDMDKTPVGQRAYMIPGPGMIGRCESSGLVCLEDADCDEEAEERCRHFFCANDPGRACHDPAITTSDRPSDAECAPSFCGSGNPTTCSTDPRVP